MNCVICSPGQWPENHVCNECEKSLAVGNLTGGRYGQKLENSASDKSDRIRKNSQMDKANAGGNQAHTSGAAIGTCCDCGRPVTDETGSVSNAFVDMIADATSLLDALEDVMSRLVDRHEKDESAVVARALIAKHRGGA